MKAEKWLFECRNLEEKYELVSKEKEVRLRSLRPSPTLKSPFPRTAVPNLYKILFFKGTLFIYLFLAALGLHCCAGFL